MITPETVTQYNRTEAELEEFLMFGILVAGKNSKVQAQKLGEFLQHKGIFSPLEYLTYLSKHNDLLIRSMQKYKLGQYNRLDSAFRGILQFKGQLKTVTVEQLESVKGIGPKTARFFVLHSRPNVRYAVLDTHILKWMHGLGYHVPKATPSKNTYRHIETDFLALADAKGMTPANLDLHIWTTHGTFNT